MTETEQIASDNLARAEIAKLIETSAALNDEVTHEHWLYPFAVVISAVLAGLAIGMSCL